MKSFLSLFLSLFLFECRSFINMDPSTALKKDKMRKETLAGTDRANHPSQPKMKYLWRNIHNFQRKYRPEHLEEVKLSQNMKPRKDSQINSRVANNDGGMDENSFIFQ